MTSYIKSLYPLGNSSIDLLAHDMRTFETKCSFNNIAYIYLPIMVHNYVSKGLQIEGEKQSIYNVVRAEKEEMEDISNKSINVILLALSFFSLISAILDGCVLINSILPFGQWFSSESVGFALFSLLFICILMCVILWFVIWGRRRSKRNQGSLIKPKLQNE